MGKDVYVLVVGKAVVRNLVDVDGASSVVGSPSVDEEKKS